MAKEGLLRYSFSVKCFSFPHIFILTALTNTDFIFKLTP